MSLTVENLYKNIHDVSLHTFFYMAFDDGQDLTYLGGYWTVSLRCSCLNSASQQLKLSHKRQMSKWRVDDGLPNGPTGSELDKMEDFQWTHICPSKYFLSWTLCVRAQWEGKADWLYPDL